MCGINFACLTKVKRSGSTPVLMGLGPSSVIIGVLAMTLVENWRLVVMQPKATIIDAMTVIDRGALRVALVVDEQYRLLGVVTDGDIRRGLLSKIDLNASVAKVMCNSPFVANVGDSQEKIFSLMNAKTIEHIPVVDDLGVLEQMLLGVLQQIRNKEKNC